MAVAVVVPWRPGDAHREAAWARLKARHLDDGRTVVEGTCEGEWCKASAVADALTRTDADVLVIHDADVWTDGLDDAVAVIDRDTRWAMPHLLVHRLAEGHEPGGQLVQAPYEGWLGGGVVVIDRAAYETCPLDPRFLGWGHEDLSFACGLTTLFGAPWRGDADLYHWWHPPQERASRSRGSRPSQELEKRYRAASGLRTPRPADRRRMLQLIEEGKAWRSSTCISTSMLS